MDVVMLLIFLVSAAYIFRYLKCIVKFSDNCFLILSNLNGFTTLHSFPQCNWASKGKAISVTGSAD
jgi:hypothetical protein